MAMRYDAPFPSNGSGPMRSPRGPNLLRIGDAERDAAAADLGEHYAAGRLNLDELHQRLDAVLAARTFGQLTRVMTDLPGLSSGRLHWPASLGLQGHYGPHGPRRAVGSAEHWAFAQPESAATPAPTEADRAGRFAALALLMLAMLLWLFTALLFARHGVYQQYTPSDGSISSGAHVLPYVHNTFIWHNQP